MDPELLPKLFEASRSGSGRRAYGAGLGLIICRRILRAHCGDLGACNLPGGGAELTVTIRPGEA